MFKRTSKRLLFIFFLLIALYLFTRMVNLLMIPIFVDEAGFIFWAKRAVLDHKQIFVSLVEDGKPPLHIWIMMPFLKAFPANLLLGARLSSVFTGFVGLVGFCLLCKELFGGKTAILGSFLYILSPFVLFYDRMALTDSAVNAVCIWILYLSILLVRKPALRSSILFGTAAGLGLLLKSNVLLTIMVSFFAGVTQINPKKKFLFNIKKNLPFIILFSVGIIIAIGFYLIQLMAPIPNFFESISAKNNAFLLPFSELLNDPFVLAKTNGRNIFSSLFLMTGILPFIFCILGFVMLYKENKGLCIYLFLWLITPILLFTFLLEHYFPRYILFVAPSIILLTSYFISHIPYRKIQYIFIAGILVCFVYFDYPILFNYHDLHFTYIERIQYVEGIASGYGMADIINFAHEKSNGKPVLLLSEGGFGVAGYMLQGSLMLHDNIQVDGYWPLNKAKLMEYQQLLSEKQVFVIYAYTTTFPSDWPLKKIKEYKKPYNQPYYTLHELTK